MQDMVSAAGCCQIQQVLSPCVKFCSGHKGAAHSLHCAVMHAALLLFVCGILTDERTVLIEFSCVYVTVFRQTSLVVAVQFDGAAQ